MHILLCMLQAYRLFSAKPLPEPTLPYYQLDLRDHMIQLVFIRILRIYGPVIIPVKVAFW